MNFSYEFVVALAPALLCAGTGFVVEVVPIAQRFMVRVVYSSLAKLDWLKEIVSHASFYGVAVSGFLGFDHESPEFFVYAAFWFIACQWFSIRLVTRLEELEKEAEEKAKIRFRKTAGMVRSIVRDELGRSASKDWGNTDS